jgi:hypothetical protein
MLSQPSALRIRIHIEDPAVTLARGKAVCRGKEVLGNFEISDEG